MRYYERYIAKAERLLDELLAELELGHAFKLIVTVWEITETLIRALIYLHLGTTYEKLQKLIFVLSKRVLDRNRCRKILPAIRKLYHRRSQIVHRAIIADRDMAGAALRLFCELAPEILTMLSKYVNIRALEERIQKVCQRIRSHSL